MNLAEAERRVDAMRTRATSRRSDGGIEGRIQRRVLQELEQWAALGWNVETLQQRVANNPTDVGMAMPGLRQAVSDHRRLRRRLEALPWERDSELGMDVLDRMRRPEALADLAHDLPQLARQLAASPPDPDRPRGAHGGRTPCQHQRPRSRRLLSQHKKRRCPLMKRSQRPPHLWSFPNPQRPLNPWKRQTCR